MKKTDDKFVAFSATLGECATFQTLEAAEKWLKEVEADYGDGNVSEEFCLGKCWIAKITHRSGYTITDRRENYCSKECSECEKDHCDEEQWPYDSAWDYVGDMAVKPIEDEAAKENAKLTEELADKDKQLTEARAEIEHWKSECNALQRMVHEARAEIEHKNRLIEQMRDEIKAKRSEYAYKDIQEYENILGCATTDSFRTGWIMARTTTTAEPAKDERDKLIEQMREALKLALPEARSTHCEQTILAALAAERGEG